MSDEAKNKISVALRGIKRSPEVRARMKEAFNKPECLRMKSENAKRLFLNPEYRAKRIQDLTGWRTQLMAKCHPDQKQAAFGLCMKCYRRKQRYGIMPDEVNSILQKQDNSCAICGKLNPKHLDHDHKTNKVRGILCQQCNHGLGQFFENTELLTKAISYLTEYQPARIE